MVAEITGGKTLQAVASERTLQVQDVPGVPRGAPVPDAAANQAYFRAAPPAAGKPTPGKVMLADGSAVVFAVTRVEPGNPDEASEQERAMLRQQLGGLLGSEDAEVLQRSLRRTMKITVNEARL